MSVRVELTYEMSKVLGASRIEVDAQNVDWVVEAVRERFDSVGADFDSLRSRTAIAVNGVLVRHREEAGKGLRDGDRVSFVKAAAGG